MPNVCSTCKHPQVREINHRIREQRPYEDISRWLTATYPDQKQLHITRQALARHHRDHLGDAAPREPGRKPVSGSFLQRIVETAHQDLEDGILRPTLKDGISAQAEINRQADRSADRDLMLRIGLALSGVALIGEARVIDPEQEAIEAEFRPLLTAGAE